MENLWGILHWAHNRVYLGMQSKIYTAYSNCGQYDYYMYGVSSIINKNN